MKWRAVGVLVAVVVFAVGMAAYWVEDWAEGRHPHYNFGGGALVTVAQPRVLVAKQLIPKGKPGSLMTSREMYVVTTIPLEEVDVGVAIFDPGYLNGRAAAVDIVPGQQLTETDFVESDAASP